MGFSFSYGGHAKVSEKGTRVSYKSYGSGEASYKSVERELAHSVTNASSGATQQAISSVTTRKIQINTED